MERSAEREGYVEAHWTGSTWAADWGVEDVNVSGAELWSALLTPNNSDDLAVFERALSGNDTFRLSNFNDVASGFSGNDLLFGGGFKTDGSFAANSGNEPLDGGDGNDGLWGQDGHDFLVGGAGSDGLVGGDGNDTLDGGDGADFLFGGDFSSTNGSFLPNSGDDMLLGGSGNDGLWGFDGNDVINGDAGDDYARGRRLETTSSSGGAGQRCRPPRPGWGRRDLVAAPASTYLYGGAGADAFCLRQRATATTRCGTSAPRKATRSGSTRPSGS